MFSGKYKESNLFALSMLFAGAMIRQWYDFIFGLEGKRIFPWRWCIRQVGITSTDAASATVHNEVAEIAEDKDIAESLRTYAYRQLTVVLTPRLMQLRRLVIGEVGRFPEPARILYERRPHRAAAVLAQNFKRLAGRDLLVIDDPLIAASNLYGRNHSTGRFGTTTPTLFPIRSASD